MSLVIKESKVFYVVIAYPFKSINFTVIVESKILFLCCSTSKAANTYSFFISIGDASHKIKSYPISLKILAASVFL